MEELALFRSSVPPPKYYGIYVVLQLEYHKSGDVTPASIKRQVRQDITKPPADESAPRDVKSKEKEARPRPDTIREWDRDKMRQSRSRSRERRDSDRRRSDDRSREKSREQDKKKRERSKERREKKGPYHFYFCYFWNNVNT